MLMRDETPRRKVTRESVDWADRDARAASLHAVNGRASRTLVMMHASRAAAAGRSAFIPQTRGRPLADRVCNSQKANLQSLCFRTNPNGAPKGLGSTRIA